MDTAFAASAPPRVEASTWLHLLPSDVQNWISSHHNLATNLSDSLSLRQGTLTENAAWDLIAGHYSPEWTSANATLKAAKRQHDHLHAPENKPLGRIGAALHSDETNEAERAYHDALAGFTIINETLRQDDKLHRVLGAVMAWHSTVTASHELSRQAASATEAFTTAITPESSAGDFAAAAQKKPAKIPGALSLNFKGLAAKLLGRQTVQGNGAPKTKAPGVSA
jgi:hypothetical protein